MISLKLTDRDGDTIELETTRSGTVLVSVNDGTLTVAEARRDDVRQMRDWLTAYLEDRDENRD